MSFDLALARVLGIEGGFGNDQKDSGGATKYGITEVVARNFGYKGDMRDMPVEFARGVYRKAYWDLLSLDAVDRLSYPVAEELFDIAVNCGPGVAAKFLQRSLNVLNREQKDYADLIPDGSIGNRTIEALGAFTAKRGTRGITVLLRALNALQGAHYVTLSERRQKDEAFIYGWLLNRVVIN